MILKAFQRSLSRGDVWSVGRRGFLGGFWNSVSKVMTADALASKITLYSAMENKGIGSIADNGWKTFNDQDYGGSSHCEAKIMHESLGINNAAILDVSGGNTCFSSMGMHIPSFFNSLLCSRGLILNKPN